MEVLYLSRFFVVLTSMSICFLISYGNAVDTVEERFRKTRLARTKDCPDACQDFSDDVLLDPSMVMCRGCLGKHGASFSVHAGVGPIRASVGISFSVRKHRSKSRSSVYNLPRKGLRYGRPYGRPQSRPRSHIHSRPKIHGPSRSVTGPASNSRYKPRLSERADSVSSLFSRRHHGHTTRGPYDSMTGLSSHSHHIRRRPEPSHSLNSLPSMKHFNTGLPRTSDSLNGLSSRGHHESRIRRPSDSITGLSFNEYDMARKRAPSYSATGLSSNEYDRPRQPVPSHSVTSLSSDRHFYPSSSAVSKSVTGLTPSVHNRPRQTSDSLNDGSSMISYITEVDVPTDTPTEIGYRDKLCGGQVKLHKECREKCLKHKNVIDGKCVDDELVKNCKCSTGDYFFYLDDPTERF